MEAVPLSYLVAGVSVVIALWNWLGPGSLNHIPTVGTSIPGLAYLSGLRYIKHAREMLQEGYNKHASKGGIFKISMPDQWLVLIAGPTLIEEVRKMPDDAVSLAGGADELLAAKHVLGANVVADPFHMPLIHAKLTRNLSDFYGIIKDEMWDAFDRGIGHYEEWHCVPALKTMIDIIARTSNRVFVGLPLCRDPAFLSIATSFTLDVSKSRFVVNLFPPVMKPVIAKLINKVPAAIGRAHEVVGPLIQERRSRAEECLRTGESWEDKPNDMLMWLIDAAIKKGYSNEVIAQYLLVVEFTAMHTTAMSFTHALYYLAADPSLAVPMREEVEAVLASEGGDWGKGVVNKFQKIDSFLRESQRLNGINSTTVWRKTLKPVTFSTGVTVPAGVFLSAAATPTHIDEQHYDNPTVFDPWRFVKSGEEKDSSAQGFVSTSVDYIPFGHGRHACPGRHFASYLMKLMMAYIVTTYDISFEPGKEGKRPENKWIGNSIIPEPTVNVMFRKRRS